MMRPVWVVGVDRQKEPTLHDVRADACFSEIRQQLAQHYGLPVNSVEVLHNRSRIPMKRMQERPPPDAQLHVVLNRGAADGLEVHRGKHTIPPKPIIMIQDMEGFTVEVCMCEIFDNGIRAGAHRLGVSAGRTPTEIISLKCTDDGCGMQLHNAQNFMRLAHTDSGMVYARREQGKPLVAGQYFSNELSRHGKGALALLFFGTENTLVTKVKGSDMASKVRCNYDEWQQEVKRTNNCEYGVDVYDVFDLASEDESYTEIIISSLRPDIVQQLSNSRRVAEWTSQLADVYYFFIHGFHKRLWDSLPPVLRPASAVRPPGGITIDLFGYNIGRTLPAGDPKPRLQAMLERFFQLQDSLNVNSSGGSGAGPSLQPFWLPVRWCPPGMTPEEVPSNVAPSAAFAASGGGMVDAGPAGRLEAVHRDFLLLLLYYPMTDGQRSKPELAGLASEVCLFPVWSGRLIPDASCMTQLPALVDIAAHRQEGAFKLNSVRLCGIVFCSPEVYTTNHKTAFQDTAYTRFMELGSTSSSTGTANDLWVWNTQTSKWMLHYEAPGMLRAHFTKYWRGLERDGELLDGVMRDGVRCGTKYKLANRDDPIMATQLVRVRGADEIRSDDMARGGAGASGSGAGTSAAAAAGGTRLAAPGGGRGRPAGRGRGRGGQSGPVLLPDEWPYNYRVVVEFIDLGPDSGTQHKVVLREWTPSWCPASYKLVQYQEEIAVISPLGPNNTEAKRMQDALLAAWEAAAPHHLAFCDTAQQNKVVANASQLSNVPGSSAFAPSQVPESLTACFATQSGGLASLDKNKWGTTSLELKTVVINWQLNKDGKTIRNMNAKYIAAKGGAAANELRQLASAPGNYSLTFTSHKTWVPQPLTYEFTVVASVPHTLRARWAGLDQLPEAKLGQELAILEITAHDEAGKVVAFPQLCDDEDNVMRQVKLVIKPSNTAHGASIKVSPRHYVAFVTEDRMAINVTWHLGAGQELKAARVHANVGVTITLASRNKLELAASEQPSLYVVSGAPKRIEPEGGSQSSPDPSSRGSSVVIPKLFVVDEHGSPVDMDASEYCASLQFEPPGAAVLHKALPGGAGPSSAAAAARRRRGADSSLFPCKLDGNVIELDKQQVFKWHANPGETVKMVVKLFKGGPLAEVCKKAAVAEHALSFKMQDMHIILVHDWIRALEYEDTLKARRRRGRGRGAREHEAGFTGEVYELNTGDNCPRAALVAGMAAASVPAELQQRITKGYELRRDVVVGQLVDVYLKPDGAMLRSTLAEAKRTGLVLPHSLAAHWNGLHKDDRQPFLQVAFVVPPAPLPQLEGVNVVVCDDSDQHDADFYGAVKVVCLHTDNVPVYPPGTRTVITRGELELPPITLQRDWFSVLNRGTATLLLLDVEGQQQQDNQQQEEGMEQQQQQHGKELGRFYVRLAPYAEGLSVLPAGRLFERVRLCAQFGDSTNSDTRRLLRQDLPQTSSSSSLSITNPLGAWAPWKAEKVKPDGTPIRPSSSSSRAAGGGGSSSTEPIHPRGLQLHDPLKVMLGEPLVLHFIATDLSGCPVALTPEQAAAMEEGGLTVEAPAGADVAFDVQPLAWSWATPPGSTTQQPQLPPNHLGGLFVNSVTLNVTSGFGPASLTLGLTGSAPTPALLRLDIVVEAGPVAADGLQLKQVEQQPAAAAAGGAGSQALSPEYRGIIDRQAWQFFCLKEEGGEPAQPEMEEVEEEEWDDDEAMQDAQQPPAAAAAAAPHIKPDPEPQLQQQPSQQQQQQNQDNEVIVISSDDDDDDVVLVGTPPPEQQQQPRRRRTVLRRRQSVRARQLASLDPSRFALLHGLEVPEGSSLKLSVQLVDEQGHEIAADKTGQLKLLHHQGWIPPPHMLPAGQQLQQQQQQQGPVEVKELQAKMGVSRGRAELALSLGVGDALLGYHVQLKNIDPTVFSQQAA